MLDPSTAPEPLTLDRLTRLIEQRLHLLPPFRRRLVEVPFGLDQPYWIEDPDFDIEYHVRELALPAPGDDRQLADQAARLHARALDRRRPLWEIYLIHGLAGGRMAVYTKVHHAAIDGVSGNDILGSVLDLSPEGRPDEPAPPWECDPEPSAARHAGPQRASRSAPSRCAPPGMTYGLARSLPAFAAHRPAPAAARRRPAARARPQRRRRRRRGPARARHAVQRARSARTAAGRSVSLPFAEVRAVKSRLDLTVNDVVMALCAGALRRWLADHDALTEAPLISAVPVSVRTEEQKGTHGNRVSMMFAPLPTHLADPEDRLRASHEAMRGGQGAARRAAGRPARPTSRSSPCRRSPARRRACRPACGCSSGSTRST